MLRTHLSIPRAALRPSALCISRGQVRRVSKEPKKPKAALRTLRQGWTTEELKADFRYPLSIALHNYLNPKTVPEVREKRSSYANSKSKSSFNPYHIRTQIVSEQLCDDTIKYLAPTLEKHKGCDILDLNPGAGLWSKKLHEFLQPRSHILVEPLIGKFETFLKPLLDVPGSKYKLCTKDPLAMETYREIVEEDMFPHQKVLAEGDPKRQEPNNSLLVTGSFCWDPPLPGLGFDSMAKQMFYHLAAAATDNDLFHAYGLARTLFWVPHDDFSHFMAQGVSGMSKGNRFLELSQKVDMAVVPTRLTRGRGRVAGNREYRLYLASDRRAIKNGEEKGMSPPGHRRTNSHEVTADLEEHFKPDGHIENIQAQEYLWKRHLAGEDTTGLLSSHAVLHYNEEIEMRRKYPEIPFDSITSRSVPGTHTWGGANGNNQVAERKHLLYHPAREELKPFFKTRSGVVSVIKRKNQQEVLATMGEEMFHFEQKILRMEDGPEKDAEMKVLYELEAKYEWGIEHEVGINYKSAVRTETDDMIAFNMSPKPLLHVDRRPFPPLLMQPAEAWPAARLSLVSAEPDPYWAHKSQEWRHWAEDFIYGLYEYAADPIVEALDRVQHGLAGILEHCPSLKDPDNGGRVLMNQLRVRMLTPPMLEELVNAYMEWPFKEPGSNHPRYFRSRNKRRTGGV